MGFLSLTIFFGIIDLIRKKRFFVYPGAGFLCLTIIIISTLTFNKLRENKTQNAAELIINELAVYNEQNGQYPGTLKELKSGEIVPGISYWVDPAKQRFTLDYDLDGWSRKVYDSYTRKWVVND